MRVLIVKTSSMGDVIHTLPALTDARAARPNLTFDWVVEEDFAEVPGWHPAVSRVIPVAIRRWRKHIFQALGSNEWKQFRTALRKYHYDLVIDAQGLLKSAWVTGLVKAPAAGLDKHSAREPLAALAYQHRYSVSPEHHAVERMRRLFALALDYRQPETPGDYGIGRQCFCSSGRERRNLVFVHGTANPCKRYPEDYWRRLAERMAGEGYRIRLPWKTDAERERARRIAEGLPAVEVLPRLNLRGMACVLAQANAVVAVDSGLGHLSAALDVPTVSLYGPSRPERVGAYGSHQIHLCSAEGPVEDFSVLTPERVADALNSHLLPPPVAAEVQPVTC